MNFLPITVAGENVYAGFWPRLGASLVDTILVLPLAYLVFKFQGTGLATAIIATTLLGFSAAIYSVFFNVRYGGTLGKLAVGIRITTPQGTRIGLREALLRSSPDIIYGFLIAVFYAYAVTEVDFPAYSMAGYVGKAQLLSSHYPGISKYTGTASNIWYWSEVIVILFNRRRRALHDFLAGTVVIHKNFLHNQAL